MSVKSIKAKEFIEKLSTSDKYSLLENAKNKCTEAVELAEQEMIEKAVKLLCDFCDIVCADKGECDVHLGVRCFDRENFINQLNSYI